jgi:hypothetical protein
MRLASPSQCLDGAEHLQVGLHMSAYGRIFLALQGRRGTAWCVGCARAADMSCSIRAGARLAAFLLQGLSEEQLSGTSLGYVPIFGHAVSLCRMIASLRFRVGRLTS